VGHGGLGLEQSLCNHLAHSSVLDVHKVLAGYACIVRIFMCYFCYTYVCMDNVGSISTT
jgi:hypothetical protein